MKGETLSKRFDGDIIIIDPDNFMTSKDWRKSSHGKKSNLVGLKTYICRKALYDDWSCQVIDEGTEKKIGEFTTISGMFGAFDLKEVTDCYPCFDWFYCKPGRSVIIKNFMGKISIVEDLDENGKPYVMIFGEGVDKETNKQINFIGY